MVYSSILLSFLSILPSQFLFSLSSIPVSLPPPFILSLNSPLLPSLASLHPPHSIRLSPPFFPPSTRHPLLFPSFFFEFTPLMSASLLPSFFCLLPSFFPSIPASLIPSMNSSLHLSAFFLPPSPHILSSPTFSFLPITHLWDSMMFLFLIRINPLQRV